MKNYQIIELENIFEGLVDYANFKKCVPALNYKNGKWVSRYENNSYIEMSDEKRIKLIEEIYKRIGQYFMSKKIGLSDSYLDAYVNIKYNSGLYGIKIYRIFCPCYGKKEFYIPDNINDVDCPIVNFEDVINYHKEENKKDQLKNIKIALNELKEQGLSKEEIENYIENILYKEIENPKQKTKRLEK